MVKRIVAGASIGWAGVVGLSWWLAHLRIDICGKASSSSATNCAVRATSARDDVLTSGLTVVLVGTILASFAWSAVRARQGGGQAMIRVRPSQPPRRPIREIASAVAASFRTGLSRTQRVLVAAAMLMVFAAPAALAWMATDIAPPAASWPGVPRADVEQDPYADLIPKTAPTDSASTYLEEETAPTSDRLDAADLLDDAANKLERATEQEAELAEAEASQD